MLRALTLGWLALFFLHGCSRPLPDPDTSKELVVITRYEPAAYYLDADGQPAGYTYELVQQFAAKNNWTVRWQPTNHYASLFEAAHQRKAHLIAASLIQDAVLQQGLHSGPALFNTRVIVVSRRPTSPINGLADLAKLKIAAMAESGHVPLLQAAQRKYPKLNWTLLQDVFPEDLFTRLDDQEFDAIVVNEQDFDLARNQHPSLHIVYELSKQAQVTWALPPASGKLAGKLNQFFIEIRRNGTLKKIYERYYGHIKRLDAGHVEDIHNKRLKVLPKFRNYFHLAQEQTSLDWRLIAAIGFQESKWDPFATSPTGVRGLMMLTGETADRMGVTNRLDAKQSILAGARYLALLKDTLPSRIQEPDRTWLALAAYNQGQGHLEDARRIAQAKGMNPDSWADVKQTLPLLARGGYKSVTKYGYARGGEAVIFVESIRNYYDILLLLEKEHKAPLFGSTWRRNTLALK